MESYTKPTITSINFQRTTNYFLQKRRKTVHRGFNARIDVRPFNLCIFSHNRFVSILAIIPVGCVLYNKCSQLSRQQLVKNRVTHPLRVAENCTTHPLRKAQNLMTHSLSAPPSPILFDTRNKVKNRFSLWHASVAKGLSHLSRKTKPARQGANLEQLRVKKYVLLLV